MVLVCGPQSECDTGVSAVHGENKGELGVANIESIARVRKALEKTVWTLIHFR